MGTSKSFGGYSDRPALLPDWALGPPVSSEPTVGTEAPASPVAPAPPDPSQPTPHPAAPPLKPEDTPLLGPAAGVKHWERAGRALAKVASSGGGRGMGRAAVRYVRALGGASRATTGARAGRRAASRFAGFLSDVSRNGLDAAVRQLGLGSVIGSDVDSVIAAIADAVCPEGASREEAAAREATAEALEEVFADVITADGDLTKLDAMTAATVAKAITTLVTSYIYNRWLNDLGAKIESKAITSQQAVRVEKRMRQFIRDAVKLDLRDRDPLKIDWRAQEGRSFMEQIYRDAFNMIGNRT